MEFITGRSNSFTEWALLAKYAFGMDYFGRVVCLNGHSQNKHSNNIICSAFSNSVDDKIKRFWEYEEVDIAKSTNNIPTKDEMLCEEIFISTRSCA